MLLELLFAVALALIVVGAVVSAAAGQGTHRRTNLDTTLVTNAIMDVFARLRTLPFADLLSYHGSGFQVPDHLGRPAGLRPVPGDLDGLPGQIAVTIATQSGATILYRVEVSVAWMCAGSRRREVVVAEMGERK